MILAFGKRRQAKLPVGAAHNTQGAGKIHIYTKANSSNVSGLKGFRDWANRSMGKSSVRKASGHDILTCNTSLRSQRWDSPEQTDEQD